MVEFLLLFTDDIAIMIETKEDLECMFNVLHAWCEIVAASH